jgi:hypothetical protein
MVFQGCRLLSCLFFLRSFSVRDLYDMAVSASMMRLLEQQEVSVPFFAALLWLFSQGEGGL